MYKTQSRDLDNPKGQLIATCGELQVEVFQNLVKFDSSLYHCLENSGQHFENINYFLLIFNVFLQNA